ncbi:MAG: DUF5686 family protein [Paludibacter sp.]|nr:DUF5686 family protein [Paludibacter sp.]
MNFTPKLNLQKIVYKLFLLIILSATGTLSAQETVVVGQVLNIADKNPIPNVNIQFKNSQNVVQSNEDGYFLIRYRGKESALIFSSIGYQKKEIKIKPGQSVGMQVEMVEENTLLQEAFVVPGVNPAADIMRKVRMLRKANDLSRQTGFSAQSTEQNLVLLSKINQHSLSKRIFDQLKKGNLSKTDSSLVIPLYMAENKYQLTATEKNQVSKNIFSSPESVEKLIEKLVGEMSTELNFYDNAVSVFGKSMISPLANVGNAFYDYYLADSIKSETGKQYEIHFRTKNSKNLAFNGKLWIDSATFALTKIEAELPLQANINFIHNLSISENFIPQSNKRWTCKSEDLALNMNYALIADSLHPFPEIFIKRTAIYHSAPMAVGNKNFAQSNYTPETLDEKLKDLNNTPLLRTAKWIAEIALTGYIPAGIFDIGKIQQFMRITDIEGLRLTLPLKTSEKLMKNISLGGFVGYGFKNNAVKYSGLAQFKIPGEKRHILSLSYTNDYRRIDYNYNDFMFRENPLVTGDEDISSSVFAMKSVGKMSERKEYSVTFATDWNSDIESNIYLRANQLYANASMPMAINGTNVASFLKQQSATFSTRFSFNERTYDDQMQRIYITNSNPDIYSTVELGNFQLGNKSGKYGKIIESIKQNVRLDFGQLNYVAEAGWIFGNVPYPLLEVPPGSETGGYSTYQFNMMNYMEYAADKYVNLHSELMLNGLIMNQIPLIKYLNLREMFSFHMTYGSLSDSHRLQLDYPTFMNPLNKPYMEVGVGLTNILHIFTLQSVWRLTDLNHAGVIPWGIRGCLNLSF